MRISFKTDHSFCIRRVCEKQNKIWSSKPVINFYAENIPIEISTIILICMPAVQYLYYHEIEKKDLLEGHV